MSLVWRRRGGNEGVFISNISGAGNQRRKYRLYVEICRRSPPSKYDVCLLIAGVA